jgi:hypothetical protein
MCIINDMCTHDNNKTHEKSIDSARKKRIALFQMLMDPHKINISLESRLEY